MIIIWKKEENQTSHFNATYLKCIFGSNITTKRMPKKYKFAKVFGFPPFLKRINEPILGFYTVPIRNLAFWFATR
jgi:hypothetical protein